MSDPAGDRAADAFDGKAFVAQLSTAPGVYRMYAADGSLLYVGKAGALKRRVASYFANTPKTPRIHAMLVNASLMVEVRVEEGVVSLCNLGEVLRSDGLLRGKIEEMIKGVEGVREIQFGGELCARPDHINPFYNI